MDTRLRQLARDRTLQDAPGLRKRHFRLAARGGFVRPERLSLLHQLEYAPATELSGRRVVPFRAQGLRRFVKGLANVGREPRLRATIAAVERGLEALKPADSCLSLGVLEALSKLVGVAPVEIETEVILERLDAVAERAGELRVRLLEELEVLIEAGIDSFEASSVLARVSDSPRRHAALWAVVWAGWAVVSGKAKKTEPALGVWSRT